jgi:hypothetical protein
MGSPSRFQHYSSQKSSSQFHMKQTNKQKTMTAKILLINKRTSGEITMSDLKLYYKKKKKKKKKKRLQQK